MLQLSTYSFYCTYSYSGSQLLLYCIIQNELASDSEYYLLVLLTYLFVQLILSQSGHIIKSGYRHTLYQSLNQMIQTVDICYQKRIVRDYVATFTVPHFFVKKRDLLWKFFFWHGHFELVVLVNSRVQFIYLNWNL